MNRYEWLVHDFEDKLQRKLYENELKWIQWVAKKETKELDEATET